MSEEHLSPFCVALVTQTGVMKNVDTIYYDDLSKLLIGARSLNADLLTSSITQVSKAVVGDQTVSMMISRMLQEAAAFDEHVSRAYQALTPEIKTVKTLGGEHEVVMVGKAASTWDALFGADVLTYSKFGMDDYKNYCQYLIIVGDSERVCKYAEAYEEA